MTHVRIGRRGLTRLGAASLIGLGLSGVASSAGAQSDYPNRPIRIVIGTPPGSGTDTWARLTAAKLTPLLKQSVIVENRPGAHSQIACMAVKNADKDGYTLLYAAGGTMAINPALYGKKLPYEPLKDFDPVVGLEKSTIYLAVNKDIPVTNLKEMIAYVKARPGKINYGTGGNGTTSHLAMEMLKRATGMDMAHVPYRGSSLVMQDLMGGQIQFAFDAAAVMLPARAAGNVRLIAVGSAQRTQVAPDIPTIAEQGVADFDAIVWSGLFAPAGTPPVVIARLRDAVNAQLKAGEFTGSFKTVGAEALGGTSEELRRLLERETARWAAVVKDANIQVDGN